MTLDPQGWEHLMDRVVAGEKSDYIPGEVQAPGSGSEGDDPRGLEYVNMGPLALVLNEAVDATVNRGIDRDALLAEIVQLFHDDDNDGDVYDKDDVNAVLSGDTKCPDSDLLQAFATAVAIDLDTIIDAARRGGCTNYDAVGGAPGLPPGYGP